MENMTRGYGWHFLDIGRRLERTINLTTLLRKTLDVGAAQGPMLEPLLEIADSSMTYRRRHFARPQLTLALDLLLLDHTNARAVAFQIDALSAHVQHLPRDPRAPSPTREEVLTARSAIALREADLESLSPPGPGGEFPALAGFLNAIREDMLALSDAVTQFYFAHGEQRVS
jgi:uncharacterized alpha-E superfamily protein